MDDFLVNHRKEYNLAMLILFLIFVYPIASIFLFFRDKILPYIKKESFKEKHLNSLGSKS